MATGRGKGLFKNKGVLLKKLIEKVHTSNHIIRRIYRRTKPTVAYKTRTSN